RIAYRHAGVDQHVGCRAVFRVYGHGRGHAIAVYEYLLSVLHRNDGLAGYQDSIFYLMQGELDMCKRPGEDGAVGIVRNSADANSPSGWIHAGFDGVHFRMIAGRRARNLELEALL